MGSLYFIIPAIFVALSVGLTVMFIKKGFSAKKAIMNFIIHISPMVNTLSNETYNDDFY